MKEEEASNAHSVIVTLKGQTEKRTEVIDYNSRKLMESEICVNLQSFIFQCDTRY